MRTGRVRAQSRGQAGGLEARARRRWRTSDERPATRPFVGLVDARTRSSKLDAETAPI